MNLPGGGPTGADGLAAEPDPPTFQPIFWLPAGFDPVLPTFHPMFELPAGFEAVCVLPKFQPIGFELAVFENDEPN